MTEPVDCNVPRCTNPSIFTEHGMVGGHYWPMCVDHAHEWLGPHIARLARLSEALDALPHAAQLTLVEARDRAEPQPDPIGDFGRSGYLRSKS